MSLIGAMVQPLAVGNRSPLSDYWYQPVGQPSLSGALINSTTAMKVSAVWGCVRLLGEIIASLPLVTYERVSEDERRKAEDNAIYWVLHDDPNPWQTHLEWVEMQTTQVLLRGNGYSEIKPGPEGPVGQLVPLSPDRMQVDWLSSGGYRYRYREPSGAERPINGEDIFHLRGLSLDGITGVSVIEYARESMGLAIASEGYAARFFGGDATPGGVLEHPGRLSPAAHDQLKKSWKQTHSGYQKAHEMAILEEGMKWHQMSLSAADSQLLESRSFQVTDVARWFRVPLHMIGSLEKETCLPADVLVYTTDGPKPVSEVAAGESVWSLSPENQLVPARVFRSEQTGVDRILTLHTRGRSLRCNARHRVLVRRRFPDPQPGIGGYRKVAWRNVWVEAGDVAVGDYLVALNGLPDQAGRQTPTREATVGFMEVCGLLLGDGDIDYLDGEKPVAVTFARHQAAPYMDHYRQMMQESFIAFVRPNGKQTCCEPGCDRPMMGRGFCGLHYRQHRKAGTLPEPVTQPVHLIEGERSTAFRSVMAAGELDRLGFGGRAHTKRVPSWVYGLAPDLQLALLRGYLDSDGTVNSRGWITYSSVNRLLLEDIRHLCMGLGIPVGEVRPYRMSPGGVVDGHAFSRASTMYQVFLFDSQANRRIGSHNPRHVARLTDSTASTRVTRYQSAYQGRGASAESRPGTHFGIPGGALVRVTRIEHSETAEPVYDLGVEGTHSFIAGGLVVHNSWGTGIENLSLGFVIYTLLPWLRRWESALSRALIVDRRRYYPEFVVAGLLRGDQKSRYDAYAVARQWGWMSVNDIRRLENMTPVEGGDVYLSPLNMADVRKPAPEPVPSLPKPTRESAHYQFLLHDAAARVIRREIAALSKAARRCASDADGWRAAVEEFYVDHAEFVRQTLRVGGRVAVDYVEQQKAMLLRFGAAAMEDWEPRRVLDLVSLALGEHDAAGAAREV